MTEPGQARLAKAPYKDVTLRGPVEGRFIFQSALSQNVLPFILIEPPVVVLPVELKGGRIEMRTSTELRATGHREMAKWMEAAERIWAEKRKQKAAKQSVYERLDYHGELTVQNLRDRHLVLYNASGTDLSAARVDRASLPAPFLVDAKLYWAACRSEEEANYLAAVLNSKEVNEVIKPFQSTGLLGERDIHKKVLDLPIPAFDSKRAEHRRLTELGARASTEAAQAIRGREMPRSLARRRAIVREALADTLGEIDSLVRKLLQAGG